MIQIHWLAMAAFSFAIGVSIGLLICLAGMLRK